MAYLFVNQDAKDDTIAKAMQGREQEHYNYEINRLNYLSVLASPEMEALPAEWPDNLAPYKNIIGEKLISVLKDADLTLVTQLQFRDRINALLGTTIIEQTRGMKVYDALLDQLPPGPRRDAAIARVMATKAV